MDTMLSAAWVPANLPSIPWTVPSVKFLLACLPSTGCTLQAKINPSLSCISLVFCHGHAEVTDAESLFAQRMVCSLGSTQKQKRSQGSAAATWTVSSYRLSTQGLVRMERLEWRVTGGFWLVKSVVSCYSCWTLLCLTWSRRVDPKVLVTWTYEQLWRQRSLSVATEPASQFS